NVIDTPGHVDFTYAVSRSLASCEGAVLLVDASQGVEAQTIANAHLAIENHLTVIPVINKVDLASADIEGTKRQIEDVLGLDAHDAVLTSAKTGTGTKDVLEAVVKRIPPPSGDPGGPLKALVFDSWFDNYQGVTVLARVGDGAIEPGMKVRMMGSGNVFEIQEVGIFTPKRAKAATAATGEVGYVVAGIKRLGDTRIGDTINDAIRRTAQPYPGHQEVKPMLLVELYPTDSVLVEDLRDARG